MPLYEYKCDNCGDVFELIQRFSDEPLTVHEKCGGPVHRLISTSALQFKGSGWYVNDYAKAGKGPNGSTKSEGDSKSDSKSESKSDSKSDSKPGSSESKSSPDSSSSSTTPAATPKPSSSSEKSS
jgi:putative FmdB family regulatory protein